MLNIANLDPAWADILTNIVQRNVEKSELERIFLFSDNIEEKARVFLWCYRFVGITENLLRGDEFKDLKLMLQQELKDDKKNYLAVAHLLARIKGSTFNNKAHKETLRKILTEKQSIDNLIADFSILLERTQILSMSKLKGVIIEGKSKEAFNKVMAKGNQLAQEELLEDVPEDEIIADEESPEAPGDTEFEDNKDINVPKDESEEAEEAKEEVIAEAADGQN